LPLSDMNSPDLLTIQVLTQAVKQSIRGCKRKFWEPNWAKHNRPSFLIWLFLSIALSVPFVVQATDIPATPPPAELLQAGDLIWPKKPGVIVPYDSRPGQAENSDAVRWQKEKEAYLDRLRSKPEPSPEEKERYAALQKMTYGEFTGYYLSDRIPSEPATYGLGNLDVGHIGIIEIKDGTPFVVEAMIGYGVRRLSYVDWLRDRPGELFWVGRLKDVPREKRVAVAAMAAEQLGKPYDFWDFNLEDTSGFYCSKLAWWSILHGAGFPPDDKLNPDRTLWYSPKQLTESQHIEWIANPGNYGSS
jgi:hypothetical protein